MRRSGEHRITRALAVLAVIACATGCDTKKPDSPLCKEAFAELDKHAKTATPFPGQGELVPPHQVQFMELCNEAPENVQQCLKISYGNKHPTECKQAEQQLLPDKRQKLKRMVELAIVGRKKK